MQTDEMITALRREAEENPQGDLMLKAAANLERLMGLVNDIRLELFRKTVYRSANAGVRESVEQDQQRMEWNEVQLMAWQNHTRKLMLGIE